MADERRYSGAEIEKIFERAAERNEAAASTPSAEHGFTLRELQEIGAEVGLEPGAVAEAATALDRPDGVQRTLGLPLSVSRTVSLPRALRDDEWEHLVADLRQTFGARGQVQQHGSLRQWTNGNLHVLVEPSASGFRLRMGTTKGQARAMMTAGSVLLAVAMAIFLATLLTVGLAEVELEPVLILSLVGGGLVGSSAVRLPGWAAERREQMEGVARRVQALVARTPEETSDDDERSRDRLPGG